MTASTTVASALYSPLAALLCFEIVKSTGMKSRDGASTDADRVERHNQLFDESIATCREARILKHTDNGFFAQFNSATDAVRCAMRFQKRLATEAWQGESTTARIGIHMAETAILHMLDRPDMPGSPGNIVENVMSLGAAGQILLSKPAADEARHFVDGADARWTRHGHYKLIGVDEPIEIWEVANSASPALPAPDGAITKLETQSLSLSDERPEQIEQYRIIELIGEGGMGTVFKAEQRTPVKRIVALKLIKLGLASKEVIARFESERQALAMMDHPHIAKVLDAGQDSLGRPYFVMEYVPGVSITKFADEKKLTIRQRLELFLQVCDAIAHAHTKAIIHRDIKAGNVLACLVDGRPQVRVIDFGIAKATTGDRLTDRTLNTQRGMALGTYESMSPEQADGSPDIDTRTDVYSLGVLLYELLTGAQPFERSSLAHAADFEIRRIIREVEPPRPSTRLTQLGADATRVAADRREQLDALCRTLRGELEWIPLMAMRKERDRRYASATQLAEDVNNYLRQLPLIAGPESRAYRLRKYVRRNHRLVASGVAATIAIATIGASMWLAHAARNRELQVAAKAKAEERAHAEDVLRRDNVIAIAQIERLESLERIRAELIDSTTRAAAKLGEDDPVTLELRHNLAATYKRLDQAGEAASLYTDVLARRRRALGEGDPETLQTLSNLAAIELERNHTAPAAALLTDGLRLAREALLPDDPVRLAIVNNAAECERVYGHLDEAEKLYREAYEGRVRALGEGNRDTLVSRNSLGVVLRGKKSFDQSERVLTETLKLRRRVFPGDDPDTMQSIMDLGRLYTVWPERAADAVPLMRELYDTRLRIHGADATPTIGALNFLTMAMRAAGKYADAEPLCRSLYERTSFGGFDNGVIATCRAGYGICLAHLGRDAEAQPLLTKSFADLSAAKQQKSRVAKEVIVALIVVYDRTNRTEDAAHWRFELASLSDSLENPTVRAAGDPTDAQPAAATQPAATQRAATQPAPAVKN